ncbi:MAG: hypothetical protein HKM28_06385, partial [Flavobacteriaceae bacterium]|nr:hypothetical protein [Flavobacteriaceae bacterium]
MLTRLLFSLFFLATMSPILGQSIAREWNEEVLNAVRNDFARPTVHARNLFHTSVAMYDIWTVFDDRSEAFFLGKQWGNYINDFRGFETTETKEAAIDEAISYAVYRLILHRFSEAPGYSDIQLAV